MSRAIVNVSMNEPWVSGQKRLMREFPAESMILWTNKLPLYSPPHEEIPYSFKAWALQAAHVCNGKDTLLWLDSSIVAGKRPLNDLWEKIEAEGCWIHDGGGEHWKNYDWTADAAYPDLFPEYCKPEFHSGEAYEHLGLKHAKVLNQIVPHVVGGAFGISMKHELGRAIFVEYLRLAQTKAFCGPWWNANHPVHGSKPGAMPCGPADVMGHRHDQSALSVIAWRLGVKLSQVPEWFAYDPGGDEKTCLIAKGV